MPWKFVTYTSLDELLYCNNIILPNINQNVHCAFCLATMRVQLLHFDVTKQHSCVEDRLHEHTLVVIVPLLLIL